MRDINNGTLWDYILAVGLSVFGGLARMLNKKDKRNISWGKIISEIVVSCFAGLMAFMLCDVLGLQGAYIGLICGVAGFAGSVFLDAITNFTFKLTNLNIKDKDNDKK